MTEIKVGKATVREVFTVPVGDPVDGGTVIIYVVKSDYNNPFREALEKLKEESNNMLQNY